MKIENTILDSAKQKLRELQSGVKSNDLPTENIGRFYELSALTELGLLAGSGLNEETCVKLSQLQTAGNIALAKIRNPAAIPESVAKVPRKIILDECWSVIRKNRKLGINVMSSELPEDQGDNSYTEMLKRYVDENPNWLKNVSDRTAFSLVREGFESLDDLITAVIDKGLKVESIPNLGRKEVAEVEQLIQEGIK